MTKLTSFFNHTKSVALLALTLSALFATSAITAKPIDVQLTASAKNTKHIKLSYQAPVRLQQVLADSITNLSKLPLNQSQAEQISTNAKIYWQGAALLVAKTNSAQKTVLDKLDAISNHWQAQERQAVLNLQTFLKKEQIGQRVFNSLDYDQVRIDLTQNPLISQDITVILPPRPNSVWIVGAVDKPQELSWRERWGADKYLAQSSPINNADNSYAWVIQPDGKVEQHPVAYWNRKHSDIAPGAIIYLGFTSLPDELETLNEELINLLRNRTL
ncbi:capsule biosynthesis GfcC family protein [Photobacterium sp. J15]|uniref:capsule biosynthesis GfcC family protein n=1 Tax=Photobacterium sp. J15 TaxID=265901 RepID=UPI0007E40F97|nr:capsule biosynthesis GfcC family protein [Photobacterium sp. J15]